MSEELLERLRATLAYFDNLFGPDRDCGESCVFIKVNDLRELMRAAGIEQVPA